jgi:hypothetical protein
VKAILLSPAMVDVYAKVLGEHLRGLLTLSAHRRCLPFLQDQEHEPFTVPAPWPWVVILGDDPKEPAPALGPDGFHTGSVAALLQAASDVTMISCEIKQEIYDRAAGLASVGLSSVIIETRQKYEVAWHNFSELHAPGKMRLRALVDQVRRA